MLHPLWECQVFQGAVIPLWIDQIKAGSAIIVTEPKMTRFIMSLDEAADLVIIPTFESH